MGELYDISPSALFFCIDFLGANGYSKIKEANRKELTEMKKREFAIGITLLSIVSSLCIKGMKAVGDKLSRQENKDD